MLQRQSSWTVYYYIALSILFMFQIEIALCHPPFVAYHGVTGAYHQQEFTTLSSQGYRIISISVYGDPSNPQYAAVWVQRSGPAWAAVHGVNAATYQSKFNQYTSQGYINTLLSITGSGSNAVFAAVFEATSESFFCNYGLTQSAFISKNQFAQTNNYIPSSISIYGGPGTYFYSGCWITNSKHVEWHVHPQDSISSYQAIFSAETQLPFRPALVSLSSDNNNQYVSIFRNDQIGNYVAYHDLSATSYQSVFNTQTSNGLFPIMVQGGGTGTNTRYTAIFATTDIPLTRSWSVIGTPTDVTSCLQFDNVVSNFMQSNNIRAGQLAISKNGTLKCSRGYTYAEPGYFITQPTSLMRLASLSKMYLEAAIQTLFDNGLLTPTTRVYSLLGYNALNAWDPRSNSITVQQLLDHQGGYNSSRSGDPVFMMRQIANYLGLGRAVTKDDMISYMFGHTFLDFTPGTGTQYSNYGYLLLGRVVEIVTGQTFENYLKNTVLAPIGITNLHVSKTLASQRFSTEVYYDDPNLGLSAVYPTTTNLVPYTQGGEGWLTEIMDSGGGLCTSAQDNTRFAHYYLVWGNGVRPTSAGNWALMRTGGMAGVTSGVTQRGSDGVDWSYIFNTRDLPQGSASLDNMVTTINNYLNSISL